MMLEKKISFRREIFIEGDLRERLADRINNNLHQFYHDSYRSGKRVNGVVIDDTFRTTVRNKFPGPETHVLPRVPLPEL